MKKQKYTVFYQAPVGMGHYVVGFRRIITDDLKIAIDKMYQTYSIEAQFIIHGHPKMDGEENLSKEQKFIQSYISDASKILAKRKEKDMDPNETFAMILEDMGTDNFDSAFHNCSNLFDWLGSRGAKPDVPKGTYIALGNGSKRCYSILSTPDGGADFIMYDYSEYQEKFVVSGRY